MLVVIIFGFVLPGRPPQLTPGTRLTSATNFPITGTVSGLVPGVASTLTLTAGNPYSVAITLTSVSVAVPSTPAGCGVSNLTLNGSAFTGSPPSVTVSGLSQSIPAHGFTNVSLPILLARAATNGCETVTFPFNYAGTASYTATTTTTLVSSANPSTFGQKVTFTATVSSSVTPDPGAPTPSGSVTFFDCPTMACTSSFAISGPVTLDASGKATYSSNSLLVGTYYIQARFTASDPTSFAPSSAVLKQVVQTPASCITLKRGGETVAKGQSVCITGVVDGGVVVQPGGALFVSNSTINGGITSNGAVAFEMCGSSVASGTTSVATSTGWVEIGDGGDDGFPPCAANALSGGVVLTGNTAGFEVGGNTVTGTSTFSTNSGTGPTAEDTAPEIEGNHFGSLDCSGNSPAPSDGGQGNTATGSKTGQCAGAGF